MVQKKQGMKKKSMMRWESGPRSVAMLSTALCVREAWSSDGGGFSGAQSKGSVSNPIYPIILIHSVQYPNPDGKKYREVIGRSALMNVIVNRNVIKPLSTFQHFLESHGEK